MNLTAVLSLAVAKIDTVRHEGIADLIDAKLERGCRSKSRGGQVFSLEISLEDHFREGGIIDEPS